MALVRCLTGGNLTFTHSFRNVAALLNRAGQANQNLKVRQMNRLAIEPMSISVIGY